MKQLALTILAALAVLLLAACAADKQADDPSYGDPALARIACADVYATDATSVCDAPAALHAGLVGTRDPAIDDRGELRQGDSFQVRIDRENTGAEPVLVGYQAVLDYLCADQPDFLFAWGGVGPLAPGEIATASFGGWSCDSMPLGLRTIMVDLFDEADNIVDSRDVTFTLVE